MTTRIVVSGAGVMASIGAGVEEFEGALYSGACGMAPSALAGSGEEQPEAPAFEVQDFNPKTWLGPKGIRVLDRSARLLSVAAHMALEESGLLRQEGGTADVELGLVCGTMFGSVHSIASFDWSGLEDGVKYVNPMKFPNTVINSPAGQAAIKHQLRGINSTISAGLASGLYALHYAADFLRFGRSSALLAGGVEELCEESYVGLLKNGFISPRARLEPFGSRRDGTLPGEGSMLWMLETEEGALRRKAHPLAEVCGFGAAHDAHCIKSYQVRGKGAVRAIQEALEMSGIGTESIGLIVASANGSRSGDKMETLALQKVFGQQLSRIPVCAPKAAFGEALGASGALLALVAMLALKRREAPPTTGCSESEEGLQLSKEPQPVQGDYALVNSFGCDGNNACLVLRRYPEGD